MRDWIKLLPSLSHSNFKVKIEVAAVSCSRVIDHEPCSNIIAGIPVVDLNRVILYLFTGAQCNQELPVPKPE